jgi:hypothetical protein
MEQIPQLTLPKRFRKTTAVEFAPYIVAICDAHPESVVLAKPHNISYETFLQYLRSSIRSIQANHWSDIGVDVNKLQVVTEGLKLTFDPLSNTVKAYTNKLNYKRMENVSPTKPDIILSNPSEGVFNSALNLLAHSILRAITVTNPNERIILLANEESERSNLGVNHDEQTNTLTIL